MHLTHLLPLLPLVLSQQILNQEPLLPAASTPPTPKRVAIIGAGSAGSSTAYFLRQYAAQASIPLNITIYERNTYIGGRTTTVHPFDDPAQPALEAGASIFVSVNQNLVNATRDLGLKTARSSAALSRRARAATPDLGVWDGTRMVLLQQTEGGWWDLAKLLWRYGIAPYRTVQLMRRTVGKFLKLYDPDYFPWRDLGDVIFEVGLADVVAATGKGYMERWEIRGEFGHDVVQASTRVNYGMGVGEVSGVIAMVCMATEGAMSVEGGNWQIFEAMVGRSGAIRSLGTEVMGVKQVKQVGSERTMEVTARPVGGGRGDEVVETFDEVVLAAPYQYSDVVFEEALEYTPEEVPYVNLHVTLLTSRHRLDPDVFGMEKGTKAPRAVLTTTPDEEGTPGPGFNSISLLREVVNPVTKTPEFAYKIFTMEPVNSTFLGKVFGLGDLAADAKIAKEDISWIYRKLWQSYPYMYPRVEFEHIKLGDHVFYTSGIESFISTMETSSLMGMNVAKVMVEDWVEAHEEVKEGGDTGTEDVDDADFSHLLEDDQDSEADD